jgi:hypothetical protein
MRGYFKVTRGDLADPLLKPSGAFSNFEAWHWLQESAAHSPMDVAVPSGSSRKIVRLERGQLTYSIRYLFKAWRWSNKRVQRFLAGLRSAGRISTTTADGKPATTATTTAQTIITICNQPSPSELDSPKSATVLGAMTFFSSAS